MAASKEAQACLTGGDRPVVLLPPDPHGHRPGLVGLGARGHLERRADRSRVRARLVVLVGRQEQLDAFDVEIAEIVLQIIGRRFHDRVADHLDGQSVGAHMIDLGRAERPPSGVPFIRLIVDVAPGLACVGDESQRQFVSEAMRLGLSVGLQFRVALRDDLVAQRDARAGDADVQRRQADAFGAVVVALDNTVAPEHGENMAQKPPSHSPSSTATSST